MATTYLTRTMTGSPTSNQKGTMSYWVKRSKLGVYQFLGQIGAANAGTHGADFNTDDQLTFYWEHDGSAWDMLKTNRVFRDTNSWYHILWNWDSTLAASGDRLQLWVNGVRETDFATETQPAQDATCLIGSAQAYTFNAWSTADYFDGLISYAYYIDGTAYPASTFGEVDSDTGEWKIITSPSVTYGNQGYLILKNGNTITDQGSNSNDWTLGGGTLTDLQDCPDDVFTTFNPLNQYYDISTLTNVNTTYTSGGSTGNYSATPATVGFNKGKFYWEMKCVSKSGGGDWFGCGIASANRDSITDWLGSNANEYVIYGYTGGSLAETYTGGVKTDQGSPYGVGDIIMCAVDCDNLAIYWGKNGTWMDNASAVTGVPTSGASKTGAMYTITAVGSTTDEFYFPCTGFYDDTAVGVMSYNFGNGYFGTDAIASEGTNASEIGKFEYDVPAGYTALSTKGLQE